MVANVIGDGLTLSNLGKNDQNVFTHDTVLSALGHLNLHVILLTMTDCLIMSWKRVYVCL